MARKVENDNQLVKVRYLGSDNVVKIDLRGDVAASFCKLAFYQNMGLEQFMLHLLSVEVKAFDRSVIEFKGV